MGNHSTIYEVKNGTPEQNITKLLDMMGGIQQFIEPDDIVILKPNGQWWNQGMTNTNALKEFITSILHFPGFKGEIILAENHHRYNLHGTPNTRGWTTKHRNGDYNYNELLWYFQNKGHKNVTKYHWVDTGRYVEKNPLRTKVLRPIKTMIKTIVHWQHSRIVTGPDEGDGYVWTDIDYSYDNKKTKMTYPIFTSQSSNTRIDFKNGAWNNGTYTNQPIKFINFAALNHHSKYMGVTSAVKNYLGIVDLTCGYPGEQPAGYLNFHHMGIPGIGGAVGSFMKTIRKADLNITTAEWVGYGSRTNTTLATRTKTILASTDPVALDYYSAKDILLPLGGPAAQLHNPDNTESPFRKYLEVCKNQGIGTLNETQMNIYKYDFHSQHS